MKNVFLLLLFAFGVFAQTQKQSPQISTVAPIQGKGTTINPFRFDPAVLATLNAKIGSLNGLTTATQTFATPTTISSAAPSWNSSGSTHTLNLPFWGSRGNAGTNPDNDFLGTTDAVDFVERTNLIETRRAFANGNQLLSKQLFVGQYNNLGTFTGANRIFDGRVSAKFDGDIIINGESRLVLHHSNNTNNYLDASLGHIQFGSNGVNNIIAGRFATGGYLNFFVNNTNNFNNRVVAGYSSIPDGILTLRMRSDGVNHFNTQVGINTPTVPVGVWLNVNGTTRTVNLEYSGSLVYISDSTAKQNIKPVNTDESLRRILSLRPKSYQYNQDIVNNKGKKIFFTAQNVENVYPEYVSNSEVLTEKKRKEFLLIREQQENTLASLENGTLSEETRAKKRKVLEKKIDDIDNQEKSAVQAFKTVSNDFEKAVIADLVNVVKDLVKRVEALEANR